MKATPVVLSRKDEAVARGGLDFSSAMESPCATCDTSPCCSFLPLPGFPVENLMQVDHARWLLGFAGIELGISASGDWSVFYTESCRFLDQSDRSCTLHGLPQQPRICQHYNPYTCWYKRALGPESTGEYLRIDEARLQALLPHLLFDDERNLVGVPTWEALHDLLAGVPPIVSAPGPPPPAAAAVVEEWREIALGRREERLPVVLGAEQAAGVDRCTGCAAYCCESLQFSVEPPTSVSGVDYLRFALGFTGVELGIADDGWSLIITTRCRHLDGGRCSIYGQPERPLRCRYFDSAQCPYPTLLGEARPEGFVKIGLEQFAGFEDCLSFDDAGNLLELPGPATVREAVEAQWHKEEMAVSPA